MLYSKPLMSLFQLLTILSIYTPSHANADIERHAYTSPSISKHRLPRPDLRRRDSYAGFISRDKWDITKRSNIKEGDWSLLAGGLPEAQITTRSLTRRQPQVDDPGDDDVTEDFPEVGEDDDDDDSDDGLAEGEKPIESPEEENSEEEEEEEDEPENEDKPKNPSTKTSSPTATCTPSTKKKCPKKYATEILYNIGAGSSQTNATEPIYVARPYLAEDTRWNTMAFYFQRGVDLCNLLFSTINSSKKTADKKPEITGDYIIDGGNIPDKRFWQPFLWGEVYPLKALGQEFDYEWDNTTFYQWTVKSVLNDTVKRNGGELHTVPYEGSASTEEGTMTFWGHQTGIDIVPPERQLPPSDLLFAAWKTTVDQRDETKSSAEKAKIIKSLKHIVVENISDLKVKAIVHHLYQEFDMTERYKNEEFGDSIKHAFVLDSMKKERGFRPELLDFYYAILGTDTFTPIVRMLGQYSNALGKMHVSKIIILWRINEAEGRGVGGDGTNTYVADDRLDIILELERAEKDTLQKMGWETSRRMEHIKIVTEKEQAIVAMKYLQTQETMKNETDT